MLILGGYYDKRKKYIKNFLVGVFKKDAIGQDTGVFYAAARIGSGLSRSQFSSISKKLEPHWNPVRVTKDGRRTIHHNPPCIEWNNAAPDFWIEPKYSIILEVV